jgi:oxamate amidohydrolase
MVDLHSAGHRRGVVCAPHFAAVEAGRQILADGGNALEAMLAMAAAIAAVYPHMNHIGGDGFWLIREPNGRVRAIMAAGPAGSLAKPELYRDYEVIPPRGPLAALTVPGAVGGWQLALEAAKANGGRLPLDVLLAPAIKLADAYQVTRSQNRLTQEHLDNLAPVPGFAATFLLDGRAPAVGATMRQEALAATLAQLAHAGLDDFYRGDVGREIAADLERIGSPVTRYDLEGYHAALAEPLRINLPEGTLYNTGAPTQGVVSLMILALFDRLGVNEAESFDHVHGLVEATKRALRVRDRVVTDPNHLPHSLDRVLEDRFINGEALKIDRRKAAPWPPPAAGAGDTIWMGAADTDGLVASYIQSLYWEFGSGCVLPATGVLMQNRGASFSLAAGALNYLAPGRLPFHTLNPALAVLADGRVMAYGCMGGDGQPQTQAALFTRHVNFREPLEQAIDAPRWVLGRTWGAARTSLRLESRFAGNLIDALASAGHEIDMLDDPYSDVMGHAGAAVLHEDGTCEGVHDPRADGGAAGV